MCACVKVVLKPKQLGQGAAEFYKLTLYIILCVDARRSHTQFKMDILINIF